MSAAKQRKAKRCYKESHPDSLPQWDATANDCQRLIDDYVLKQTVRFEDFVNIWKAKAYSVLQCAVVQRLRNELIEFVFSRFILHLRSDSLLHCVASIYALYSTYVTQTAVPKTRIRLTVHLYQRIKQVHAWAKSEEHSDLDFVIRQLEWKKSFDIAVYGSELMIGSGKPYMEGGDPLDEFLTAHPVSHKLHVLPPSEADTLDELMKEYIESKKSLSDGLAILEPLNYLQPSVTDQLKSLATTDTVVCQDQTRASADNSPQGDD